MKIYLVTRKDYDLRWGAFSKELANINKMASKINKFKFNKNKATIITSPFGDDIEAAKILGKKINVEKIEICDWFVFRPGIDSAILSSLNKRACKEKGSLIIVACRAVVATLKKSLKKLVLATHVRIKNMGNELYLIEIKGDKIVPF